MSATLKPEAMIASSKKPWKAMSHFEKATFVAKAIIMVCSFGFIYGNIWAP